MTILKGWSAFFVVAAAVANATAFGAFSYSVEPATIRPGEGATLVIKLPESDLLRPPTEDDVPEADDQFLLKTPKLELLDQDYKKENGTYVWRYRFTSYELGELFLPPVSVTFGPQSFSTERLPLKIESGRQDQEMRPDAGKVAAPWNWAWLGMVALFLVIAALAYRFLPRLQHKWKSRPKKVMVAPPPPPENPLEWLRKQLLVLRAVLDNTPDEPTAPDRWFQIMKEFVARRSHKPVVAWTTPEMRKRLQGDDKLVVLAKAIEECDRFKFSPERDGKAKESPGRVAMKWIEESEKLYL